MHCFPKWVPNSRLNVTDNQSRVMIHRLSRTNQLIWRKLMGRSSNQISLLKLTSVTELLNFCEDCIRPFCDLILWWTSCLHNDLSVIFIYKKLRGPSGKIKWMLKWLVYVLKSSQAALQTMYDNNDLFRWHLLIGKIKVPFKSLNWLNNIDV